jgi:hypothetical protein
MEGSQKVIMFGKYNRQTFQSIRKIGFVYCNWVLKEMNVGVKMLEFQNWL